MKCGIVILNYNSHSLTCELIKKCLSIDLIEKIILIDNDSDDDFEEFLRDINSSKIKYIKNHINTGYAAGNNLGLKYLYNHGFDIAFVANPDVMFDYLAIEKMKSFLENNNQYGIVSSIRTQNGTKNTGQFWTIPSFYDALWESVFIGRKIQGNKNKILSNKVCDKSTSEVIDVEVVGGAFFGCNLKIMSEIDFLDEKTFLWYEENILAFKLKKYNYKEAILTTCTYEHNHKKNGHGNLKHNIFINSKKHYCYKYLKINSLQKVILGAFDFIGMIENKLICYLYKGRRNESKKNNS